MHYDDNYSPADPNDYDNEHLTQERLAEESKRIDKGYNVIYRPVRRNDGKIKNKKIEVYTSSGIGNHIRDAETGEYYPNLVGSKDEELFFKVGLSTGECKSANGSSTLFYLSPQHYATHFRCSVSEELVESWETRRKVRLEELKNSKKVNTVSVEVN